MASTPKKDRTERERRILQLARRLLSEAGPDRKRCWGIADLLAAYKVGQALNEFITPQWWDLEIHKISMLFPWDEWMVNELADDMRRNGYNEDCPPIVLFENKVLDGKMRLEAARRAQVTPRFATFDGDARAALVYAFRVNGRRPGFTEFQRKAIVMEMGVD